MDFDSVWSGLFSVFNMREMMSNMNKMMGNMGGGQHHGGGPGHTGGPGGGGALGKGLFTPTTTCIQRLLSIRQRFTLACNI